MAHKVMASVRRRQQRRAVFVWPWQLQFLVLVLLSCPQPHQHAPRVGLANAYEVLYEDDLSTDTLIPASKSNTVTATAPHLTSLAAAAAASATQIHLTNVAKVRPDAVQALPVLLLLLISILLLFLCCDCVVVVAAVVEWRVLLVHITAGGAALHHSGGVPSQQRDRQAHRVRAPTHEHLHSSSESPRRSARSLPLDLQKPFV